MKRSEVKVGDRVALKQRSHVVLPATVVLVELGEEQNVELDGRTVRVASPRKGRESATARVAVVFDHALAHPTRPLVADLVPLEYLHPLGRER